MARERQLVGRREDPDSPRRASCRGGQDERRLGQVELQRQSLHGRLIEATAVLEDAQGIAAEHRFSEDVDESKAQLQHVGRPGLD